MALNRLLSPIKKVKAPRGGKERYVLRNYSALEQQMGQKKKKISSYLQSKKLCVVPFFYVTTNFHQNDN